nr:hypothetical protein [Candidatus Mycoplasma haematolamae]
MLSALKPIACMFVNPAAFKVGACVVCGSSVVGAGAYGIHAVRGGGININEVINTV